MYHIVNRTALCFLAGSFALAASVEVADAGGSKRKRNGIMRLGGPVNGTTSGFVNGTVNGTSLGFVDRTGGPSLRDPASVRAFLLELSTKSGNQL